MFRMVGARCNGKSRMYLKLFERACELELEIEFAKSHELPYDNFQTELDKIYEILDMGKNKL